MKSSLIFGLLNSIVGFLIGLQVFLLSIGDYYDMFVFAAPIAMFICGSLFWRFVFPSKSNYLKVIIVGILTGTVSHYLCFILISIILKLCYLITGGCLDSMGNPPTSIGAMILGGWVLSFFSLILFGWKTVLGSISIAVVMKYVLQSRKKEIL